MSVPLSPISRSSPPEASVAASLRGVPLSRDASVSVPTMWTPGSRLVAASVSVFPLPAAPT